MFFVYLIGSIGVQVWAWRRLIRRLQLGSITKLGGALRYTGWAFLPLAIFVAGFALMVGIEELLPVAIIEERAALLVFPLFGLSSLGTIAFAVRCAFLRTQR